MTKTHRYTSIISSALSHKDSFHGQSKSKLAKVECCYYNVHANTYRNIGLISSLIIQPITWHYNKDKLTLSHTRQSAYESNEDGNSSQTQNFVFLKYKLINGNRSNVNIF